ncbi:MAG: NAD(+) synthase [Steroidobacteraceae bacterium]
MPAEYSPHCLDIDCDAEISHIDLRMQEIVLQQLRRRGVIIAMSGGVDSSVCAALAVHAFGRERVLGLLLPEHESAGTSAQLGQVVAEQLGIEFLTEHIGPALEAVGCYRRRDEAIKVVFPEYTSAWKSKIIIAGGSHAGMTFFKLVVQTPNGELQEKRLPAKQYLQIVAATNYKQRLRKAMEYYHADRLHYSVIGTPNRLEYDQGFFVKGGDGLADVKPIAHLYKTQVYQLARHLRLPADVCNARPTTDTYSLAQGQDEFYFGLPYEKMDVALWCHNHHRPVEELAAALELPETAAARIYADIESKRRTTAYLHTPPLLIEPVDLPKLAGA